MSNYLFIITLSFILGLRLSTCRHLVPSIRTPLGTLSAVRSACLLPLLLCLISAKGLGYPAGSIWEWLVRDERVLIDGHCFHPNRLSKFAERERERALSSSRRRKEETWGVLMALHEKVAETRAGCIKFWCNKPSSNRAIDNIYMTNHYSTINYNLQMVSLYIYILPRPTRATIEISNYGFSMCLYSLLIKRLYPAIATGHLSFHFL